MKYTQLISIALLCSAQIFCMDTLTKEITSYKKSTNKKAPFSNLVPFMIRRANSCPSNINNHGVIGSAKDNKQEVKKNIEKLGPSAEYPNCRMRSKSDAFKPIHSMII